MNTQNVDILSSLHIGKKLFFVDKLIDPSRSKPVTSFMDDLYLVRFYNVWKI